MTPINLIKIQTYKQPCKQMPSPTLGYSACHTRLLGNDRKRTGFTLIELSIVIVIIGLIIGGVLVGRDLITASEIRAQISQIEKYQTAANTFRVKYGALPGDIKNADAVSYGFATRGTVAGQGNGDNLLEGSNFSLHGDGPLIATGETALFWRDLADANLIDGSFTADVYAYGAGATSCNLSMTGSKINLHFPQAKIANNNVYVWSGGATYLSDNTNNRVNYFAVSKIIDPCAYAMDVSMTPNQAYTIDKKIDDGLPQSGGVLAMYPTENAFDMYYAGVTTFWAAGGYTDPSLGQGYGGACDPTTCGPITASSSIAVDPQSDYNGGAGIYGTPTLDCYDNRNVTGATAQYSTQFMGGNNQACALSFKFQ